jgi:ribosomal protein L11 methyltransferase
VTGLFVLRLAAARAAVEEAAGVLEGASPAPLSVATYQDDAGAGWWLEALYGAPPDRAGIAAALAAGLGAAPPFDLAPLPDRDWVAHSLKGLSPVRGGRFVVHGAHDRGRIPPGALAIEIEAGQAFGTGHHETTRGCLIALSDIARRARPARVLDLGTGSGVLAIAAAMLWRVPVLATDIDPVAVRLARANARANGLGSCVEVVCAAGTGHRRIAAGAPYDLVVANILAGPLARLAPAIAAVLSRRSMVILSGLLESQARGVAAAYRGLGLAASGRRTSAGWTTLVLVRWARAGARPKGIRCTAGGRSDTPRP